MALPPFLSSIIDWLRAGYPEGVPDVDYIPLFALLGSQLTNEEVSSVAELLASQSDQESAAAIQTDTTEELLARAESALEQASAADGRKG